jgi:hypothetical protein
MNRIGVALALLALAVLGGAGGYWFYTNFSLVTEEVDVGFPPAAKLNSLLAAEHFLSANGRTVKSLASLRELPPPTATLIVIGARLDVGEARAEELLDWVEAGGHLIVEAETADPDEASLRTDWLLDALGISAEYTNKPSEAYAHPLDLDLAEADDFMLVQLPRNHLLVPHEEVEPDAVFGSEYGSHVLRYAWGDGVLTVLNTANFMQNPHIGDYDNAAFLLHLLNLSPDGEVWLVYAGDMPPLWKWVWEHAWMAVLSAAILMTAWLVARGRRFGPAILPPPLERRRLVDHILASGLFLWRTGHRHKLLHSAREAVRRALVLRQPGLALRPAAEQVAHLAALSGEAPEDVERAMLQPAADELDFTRTIQLLAKLREEL